MTRDDIRKILGENATEEQITNTLNALHNQTTTLNNKIKELENNATKYSDYDEIKRQLDAINNQKLTEQERLNKDKEEIAKNLKESRIIKNKAKVMTILSGIDLDEEIIDSIVGEDENTSIAKAQKLVQKLNSLVETTKKKTEEDLANLNVKPNLTNTNPNGDSTMDFEKFSKLSAEEQNKFISDHPEEFKKFL